MIGLLCLCFALSSVVIGLPYNNKYRPQRTVMFGGYYGQPVGRTDYLPEGGMTAFAAGDTIATNSFAGEESNDFEQSRPEIATQQPFRPTAEEDTYSINEETSSNEDRKTKRIPKKKPQKPSNDRDEEGNDGWPFSGVPGYNTFFPIMIGGGSPSRRRSSSDDEGGYYPGSATAIANSFSTGRGGVATSHATSFGDPYLAEMFRNRKLNPKKNLEE